MQGKGWAYSHTWRRAGKGLVMVEAETEVMGQQEPGSQGCSGHVKMQETGPVLRSGPADSSAFRF